MADEKNTNETQAADKDDKKAAAKAAAAKKKKKKEKVEDKPFNEFITQHFVPNLEETLGNQNIGEVGLTFEQSPIPIEGYGDEAYWQVIGTWGAGGQFRLIFQKEDIKGPKFYTAANPGTSPTTLESFMIDERRVTLDLMVFYVVQRLNGQKWLGGN